MIDLRLLITQANITKSSSSLSASSIYFWNWSILSAAGNSPALIVFNTSVSASSSFTLEKCNRRLAK